MLFLNRGFMEQKTTWWIGNFETLGPDPQDFPRLARPSPRCDDLMVVFFSFWRYLKIPQELTEIEAFLDILLLKDFEFHT